MVEAIRKRPFLYIGDLGQRGLHRVLFQLVANSLTESAAGFGCSIQVTLGADGSVKVADDGRGLPPAGSLPDHPTRIDAFTPLVGYRDNGRERNWLDYAVAGAISEWLWVETRYEGYAYQQDFQWGKSTAPARLIGPSPEVGLTVAFKPDSSIFEDSRFSPTEIRDRLWQYACLHSGLRITLSDEATGNEEVFEFEDGIRALVESHCGGRLLHPETLVARGDDEGVRFEVGLRWHESDSESLSERSYVNGDMAPEGGTHIIGMRDAVTRALNAFVRERVPGGRVLTGDQARSGLTAVVSVRMADPMFLSQTKARLESPEARRAVETGVERFLREYFRDHPDVAERIVRAAASRPPSGGPIWTEADWQSSTAVRSLLWFAAEAGSKRKAMLFLAACYRLDARGKQDPELLHELETYADGLLSDEELRRGRGDDPYQRRVVAAVTAADFGPSTAYQTARRLARDHTDRHRQADLVRDLFGNPFRPVTADPAWLTPTVLALARGIDADRAFDRLPVLADALQDAGCEHADLLTHCRDPRLTHARGCWVVDLILGRR